MNRSLQAPCRLRMKVLHPELQRDAPCVNRQGDKVMGQFVPVGTPSVPASIAYLQHIGGHAVVVVAKVLREWGDDERGRTRSGLIRDPIRSSEECSRSKGDCLSASSLDGKWQYTSGDSVDDHGCGGRDRPVQGVCYAGFGTLSRQQSSGRGEGPAAGARPMGRVLTVRAQGILTGGVADVAEFLNAVRRAGEQQMTRVEAWDRYST